MKVLTICTTDNKHGTPDNKLPARPRMSEALKVDTTGLVAPVQSVEIGQPGVPTRSSLSIESSTEAEGPCCLVDRTAGVMTQIDPPSSPLQEVFSVNTVRTVDASALSVPQTKGESTSSGHSGSQVIIPTVTVRQRRRLVPRPSLRDALHPAPVSESGEDATQSEATNQLVHGKPSGLPPRTQSGLDRRRLR